MAIRDKGTAVDLSTRQLASSLPAHDGETLLSWLEHHARERFTSPVGLAKTLGLSPLRITADALTPNEISRAEHLARLPSGRLPYARHPWTVEWPAAPARVAYCPECLADHGRWLVDWATPWAIACVRHGLLLADTCPNCNRSPRDRRPILERTLDSDACHRLSPTQARLGRLAPRCEGRLSAATRVAADLEHLNVQTFFNSIMTCPTQRQRAHVPVPVNGIRVPPVWLARDLSHLMTLLPASPADRILPSAMSATDADAFSRLYLIYDIARQPTLDEAAQACLGAGLQLNVMAIQSGRPYDAAPSPWLQSLAIKADRTRLTFLHRIQHRADSDTPTFPVDHFSHPIPGPSWPPLSSSGFGRPIMVDAAHVPSTIWPSALDAILPADHPLRHRASTEAIVRAVFSMSLLASGRRLGWSDAASQLLLPESWWGAPSRIFRELGEQNQLDVVLERLASLGEYLHDNPPPIDYWRRRRTFAEPDPFTRKIERWTLHKLDERLPHVWTRRGLLEARASELLTGTSAEASLADREDRIVYRSFLVKAKPERIDEALQDNLERLLLKHRLDEPVAWEPTLIDGRWSAATPSERVRSSWDAASYQSIMRGQSARFDDVRNGRGSVREEDRADPLLRIRFNERCRDRARLVLLHVEHQNASEAARIADVHQRAVINATNWLERTFDEELFQRRKAYSGLQPTLVGQRRLGQIERVLAANDWLEEPASDAPFRTLRLGARD